jgi:hypothetical protein
MYYYYDNWTGARKEFSTYRQAKTAATQEDGISITILGPNGFLKIVDANKYCHP